ncbi:hypothetical protein Vadar_031620 [Vaccinium darrowii]|uniref:Uncharacterized protein n=1 Tax=Vaccinium darrowii TaxID=229202 RepID=A0ACB7Y3Z9_9ERIC|nr:hypothetical protein Vadar_031620 [Vaccinium darrowii]
MEGVEHMMLNINGINMHISAFAALGYRAVAPDLRGYGDTESPEVADSYNCLHVVGDLVALLDSLGAEKVFVVGHDFGAQIGWYLCLFRPDRVRAYVALTVPFRPRHPKMKPIESMRAFFGEEYYMCRFQKPGEIEAEIATYGTREVLKKIITDRNPGPPSLPKGNPFGISPNASPQLPSWFSEDDLKYYVSKFEQKEMLTAPWTGAKVKVPVKFIVGDQDMVYTTPGMKEYVHNSEGFKKDVPLLEEPVVLEGVGHFLNQERPEEVNTHIHNFIKMF